MSSLVLSGWAQPDNALHVVEEGAHTFDYSDFATPEETLEALEKFSHVRHVVAWSMGGQLALKAIAQGVLKPQHLTLIGVPYRFVSDGDIKGMDPLTFSQFRENYASNPTRTKTRFHGLVAKNDRDFSRVLSQLAHHEQVENVARWLPWLDHLAAFQIAEEALAHAPPTLIIHGMNDSIVPHTQAQLLGRILPRATVSLWPEVGHAPHLHDAKRLQAEIAKHRAAA